MRETLYLRLNDTADTSPLEYAVVGNDATTVNAVGRVSLSEDLAALAFGRRLIVLAPAAAVRLTRVEIPLRQARKVLQAVPFLLEEQLAEDVEGLHFALGPLQPDGSWPVAVTSLSWMQAWTEALHGVGLEAERWLPELLCLPWDDAEHWHAVIDDHQVLVRTAAYQGFACDITDYPLYAELAAPAPLTLPAPNASGEAGADSGQTNPSTLPRLQLRVPRGSEWQIDGHSQPVDLRAGYRQPIEALVQDLRQDQVIDLLQGTLSRRENLQRYWRPWRLAAGLAAGLFALGLVNNAAHALHDAHAAEQQQAANAARFHQLFPNQPELADLALQVQQQKLVLGRMGGPGGLFFLLHQCAGALHAATGLQLQTARYNDGVLYVDLSGKDLQDLEKLRDYFRAHPRAHLDVQSANASGGKAQIRIKVSPA